MIASLTHHSTASLPEFPDVWKPANTVTDQEDGRYDEADLSVPHLSQITPLGIIGPTKQRPNNQHWYWETISIYTYT